MIRICAIIAILVLALPARAADFGAQWDFVPNLNDGAITVSWHPTHLADPTHPAYRTHWLRNINSSTASTLPIFWSSNYRIEPALQDINVAQLWLVILPSTSIRIRLVQFDDGFITRRVIKDQPFTWPGYGWVTMRLDVTDELAAVAQDIWENDVTASHLGIQIVGQADVRRATLTIQ